MSRMLWIVTALLAALAGVAVAWFMGLRPAAEVHPDTVPVVAALHAQLRAQDIATRVGRVRNQSADVLARHIFQLEGPGQRRFYVLWCKDEAAAAKEAGTGRDASGGQYEANGRLVLYLPGWPPGDPLAERVRKAFLAFDARAAEAPPK